MYERLWREATSALPFAARVRAERFASLARGRIVDIGAGNGALAGQLDHPEIVSVDQALAGLESTQGTRLQSLGEHLSVRSACADTVVLQEVLEHVGDPVGVLREARRVLAPGGRVLISVPRLPVAPAEALFRRIKFGVWPGKSPVNVWDPEHERRYRLEDIRRLVEAAGFTVDVVEPMFGSIATAYMYFAAPRRRSSAPESQRCVTALRRADRVTHWLGTSTIFLSGRVASDIKPGGQVVLATQE